MLTLYKRDKGFVVIVTVYIVVWLRAPSNEGRITWAVNEKIPFLRFEINTLTSTNSSIIFRSETNTRS